MTDSDDRRLRSAQFLGTVTNLEEFKQEKARKKAMEKDQRPDAEIIDFPITTTNAGDRVDFVGSSDDEAKVRSKMTEEEKAKEPPMHEHDCD